MHSKSLFLLICMFLRSDIIIATCTVSKYETGIGDRMQCSNVSLATVQNEKSTIVSAIIIFHSRIPLIPDNSFSKYGKSLESLNMNDCGIVKMTNKAFAGLTYLKTLGLSNNNITELMPNLFSDLMSLEQLDLSFNRINIIDNIIFQKLTHLRRLDISENKLRCIDPQSLSVMPSIEKVRLEGNPWKLSCRGQLTLWLRDHGVNYKSDPHGPESWLDRILWRCQLEDPVASQVATNQCVFFNLFNQLRTALLSVYSNPSADSKRCTETRNSFIKCLSGFHTYGITTNSPITNGEMIRKILLHLERAATTIKR